MKKYGDSIEAEYVVKQLLDFDDLDAFRDYIRTLFGKLDMSEELWKKDRDGILANPAKLKNYHFELTADVLDDYVRYYNAKKSCRAVALTAFLLHLRKPVYLCKFSLVKSRRSRQPMFSVICSGRLAPISTVVTALL